MKISHFIIYLWCSKRIFGTFFWILVVKLNTWVLRQNVRSYFYIVYLSRYPYMVIHFHIFMDLQKKWNIEKWSYFVIADRLQDRPIITKPTIPQVIPFNWLVLNINLVITTKVTYVQSFRFIFFKFFVFHTLEAFKVHLLICSLIFYQCPFHWKPDNFPKERNF